MTFFTDILSDYYTLTLSIHIMAVISWMAGIFYLPRLFVYHAEKASGKPGLDSAYQEMELKLYRIIMRPAMMATWIFGILLALTPGIVDWSEAWPWVKFLAVILMTGFHGMLGAWMKAFQHGENDKTGRFFRFANEAPTILMVIIVIMVVVRPF